MEEIIISAVCGNSEDFSDFLLRVRSTYIPSDAEIICQDIFGPPLPDKSLTASTHPVTWILPLGNTPHDLTGTQIWAIRRRSVERVIHNGRIVGSVFEDDHFRFCRLGGLGIGNPNLSREIQAHHAFFEMQQILSCLKMDFHDVMRTWFYNDRILDWYDTFNFVRTTFFRDQNINLSQFPASTGIGAGNPLGASLTAGLLTAVPKCMNAMWKTVESPMQENPDKYGSSFSRAAELITPDYHRLFISGTASISYDGLTMHHGDIYRQIELSMQVISSILDSRGMDWTDVTRGLAYFKEPLFLKSWRNWCEQQSISLPLCTVYADICRRDLLFEIEVDAVTKKDGLFKPTRI